ncbi:MAG: hypothetical protein DI537_13895 [Stutzerimonas stutzeri]|nr:MAG: hypothetical protein DI537_13895 [Stutzerimonas stutzeri]
MILLLNWLGAIAAILIFATLALWASLLIPIVLGCATVLFVLFLALTAMFDGARYLWIRIRSPPASRKRQR